MVSNSPPQGLAEELEELLLLEEEDEELCDEDEDEDKETSLWQTTSAVLLQGLTVIQGAGQLLQFLQVELPVTFLKVPAGHTEHWMSLVALHAPPGGCWYPAGQVVLQLKHEGR